VTETEKACPVPAAQQRRGERNSRCGKRLGFAVARRLGRRCPRRWTIRRPRSRAP